jgi:predicted alternative tryptophan synthase beta-subunit
MAMISPVPICFGLFATGATFICGLIFPFFKTGVVNVVKVQCNRCCKLDLDDKLYTVKTSWLKKPYRSTLLCWNCQAEHEKFMSGETVTYVKRGT